MVATNVLLYFVFISVLVCVCRVIIKGYLLTIRRTRVSPILSRHFAANNRRCCIYVISRLLVLCTRVAARLLRCWPASATSRFVGQHSRAHELSRRPSCAACEPSRVVHSTCVARPVHLMYGRH